MQRLSIGGGKVLLTTQRLYARKVEDLRPQLPNLQYVLLADIDEDLSDDVLSLPRLMERASPDFTIPPTNPEDPALLHFTSGTTGSPKASMSWPWSSIT